MGPCPLAILLLLPLLFLNGVTAPPPNNRQAAEEVKASDQPPPSSNEPIYKFPYSKYLETVVKLLESEPKMQEKIRGMNEEEIKSGKLADHLHDLPDDIFAQLTKAKLEEIERLREEIQQQITKEGDARNIQMPEHIDSSQWERFTKDDLRKLIQKTVADMTKIDEQRRENFKKYELEKKAQEDHRLAQMSSEERQREQREIDEKQRRHNEHEKINHPGGREQLEEVWEERDGMEKDAFNPRTFFALHDLNGDGYWNEQELEALFQTELEKVYNETDPDDDPKERLEEMERMREHVVNQMDKNGDRIISLDEFLQDNEAQSKDKHDEGWEDLAKQKLYTEEELKRFEEEYARQQGWGEHAYTGDGGSQNLGQQAQVHLSQDKNQPPPPPVAQQPIVPQGQPVVPPQAGAPPPPVPVSVPEKVPKAVDPVYGI